MGMQKLRVGVGVEEKGEIGEGSKRGVTFDRVGPVDNKRGDGGERDMRVRKVVEPTGEVVTKNVSKEGEILL